MAGTKIINNIYNYDDTFEPETESKEYLEIGYLSVEFTNMDRTAEKKLKDNSVVDINGSIYVFDIAPGGDETITGTLPSDGDAYARFYIDTGVAYIEWTTDALPDFDYNRKGYYDASDRRYVMHVYMYDDIMVRDEIILNSYDVEQEAWNNRSSLSVKLTQAGEWSLKDVTTAGNRIDYLQWNTMINKVVGFVDDTYIWTDDGLSWTSPVAKPAWVTGLPLAMNDDIAVGYISGDRFHNMYNTTDMVTFNQGEEMRFVNDQKSYEYSSVVTDELLGTGCAWNGGVGCAGAPGYSSGRGIIYFAEYNYDTGKTASDGVAGDEFGYSVAAQRNTSYEYFLVGAPGGNAAYEWYYVNSATITQTVIFAPPTTPGANDRYGHSVAFDGSYKVIGAPGANKVYVYLNNVYQATLSGSNNFGMDVSINGDYLIVGSDDGAEIFLRSGTTWPSQQTIAYGDGAVSIWGSKCVIGDATNSEVKVYTRSGTVWSLDDTITESGDYGTAVEIVDELFLVGAPSIDRVYAYRPDDGNRILQIMTPRLDTYTSPIITGALFGTSVAIHESFSTNFDNYRIMVGTPAQGIGGKNNSFLYQTPDIVNGGAFEYGVTPQGWNEDLQEFYGTASYATSNYDCVSLFIASDDGIKWYVKNRYYWCWYNCGLGLGLVWNSREQKYHSLSTTSFGNTSHMWDSLDGGYTWNYLGFALDKGAGTYLPRRDKWGYAEEIGMYWAQCDDYTSSHSPVEDYFYISSDGENWDRTLSNVYSPNGTYWASCIWHPELKIWIMTGTQYGTGAYIYNIMYSSDAYNWTYIKPAGLNQKWYATHWAVIPYDGGEKPGTIMSAGYTSESTQRLMINK